MEALAGLTLNQVLSHRRDHRGMATVRTRGGQPETGRSCVNKWGEDEVVSIPHQ